MNVKIDQTQDLTAKAITVAVLETLATEQSLEVAEVGSRRLDYFIGLAKETTEADFNKAIKEFRDMHKDKDGKAIKTFAVRASEFQTIYHAFKHGMPFDNMGYAGAVSAGRAYLDQKGLRGNGKPKLSSEDQQANREKNDRAKAAREAAKLVDFGQPDAMVKFADETARQYAAIVAERTDKHHATLMGKADDLVASIVAEGEEYASVILAKLSAALGYEMEIDNKLTEMGEMLKAAA